MIKRNCKQCKKEFLTRVSRNKINRGIFCSKNCFDIYQKGKKPWNTGKKCPQLSKSKMGDKNPMWNGGVSKKESDRKYSKTESGKNVKQKAIKKFYSKEENKEKRRKYNRERIKNNIHAKLKRNISNLIWCKLKRNRGFKKDRKISECLPYTIEELKTHLENLFLKGMSWSNYGEWHIDHKIPDSSFKYKTTEDLDFKKSWALKNLQPLWAIDNIKKGNKLIK
ncbi:MAG: hypothetical protein WCX46_03285 [Candidatus Paceibacterota bacterium]